VSSLGLDFGDNLFADVLENQVVTISGRVWNDNGPGDAFANGLPDSGEGGVAGAIVSLSSGMAQTTGSDGIFLLYGPPNEQIMLTETDPDGYFSTDSIPGNNAQRGGFNLLVVDSMTAGSISANNLFGDVQPVPVPVLTGIVFDDADEDGMLDETEGGLPGVIVTLEIGGNTIAGFTNSAGCYMFAVPPGVAVRITSTGPGSGYYFTTPTRVVVPPPDGGLYPSIDFGYSDDTDSAVICGTLFEDSNGDGNRDNGELGIGGATIKLNDTTSTFTDNLGRYLYRVSTTGDHIVVETDPTGYFSTTPNEVHVAVALGNGYMVDFGDALTSSQFAAVYGTVFEDTNGDGDHDYGEPGISGVTATLDGTTTHTTDEYGSYSFPIETAGVHTIVETDPPDHLPTTPNEVPVDVALGNGYKVNFGDLRTD